MVVDVTTVLATTTKNSPRLTQHFLTDGTTECFFLRCMSVRITILVGMCMSQRVSGRFLTFCSVGCTAHCAYRNLFPSGLSALKIRVIVRKNDVNAQIQIILKSLTQ